MERMKLFKLGVGSVLVMSLAQAFAVPLKTWDAIFNAEGQGEYSAAKIDGWDATRKHINYLIRLMICIACFGA